MSDAALTWNDFGADIAIENGDLRADEGLATAVLVSLFTDARAPSVDLLPEGATGLRGWWGDFDSDEPTGSLLWLINREKVIPETAEKAREYCVEALRWLIDEEIAESYEVDVKLIKLYYMQITIAVRRGTAQRYDYLWQAVEEYTEQTVQSNTIKVIFED